MSKIDKIKEKIGYLKVVFGILAAIDISLIGWLAQQYETASTVTIVVSFVAMIGVSMGMILVNRAILANIDELEDL